MRPEIKICGLTDVDEIASVNAANPEYAGFVFYPKSKRNIFDGDYSRVEKLIEQLSHTIKKVAVCVSPDGKMLKAIESLGFDIIQIHGSVEKEAVAGLKTQVWRAVNVSSVSEAKMFDENPEQIPNVTGYVIDGSEYGGGKTFGWEDGNGQAEIKEFSESVRKQGMLLILAGGLTAENVRQGIRIFSPDIVDVSSGVEGTDGKDREKIVEFIRKVRES